jgi:hypothetical protein
MSLHPAEHDPFESYTYTVPVKSPREEFQKDIVDEFEKTINKSRQPSVWAIPVAFVITGLVYRNTDLKIRTNRLFLGFSAVGLLWGVLLEDSKRMCNNLGMKHHLRRLKEFAAENDSLSNEPRVRTRYGGKTQDF